MVLRLILLWTVHAVLASAAITEGELNLSEISCVERLHLPDYPLLARAANSSGTVTARVVLSGAGSVKEVTTDFTGNVKSKGLFASPVESLLRTAKFRSTCGGRTVTLTFHFELVGKGSDYPRQSTWFGERLNTQP